LEKHAARTERLEKKRVTGILFLNVSVASRQCVETTERHQNPLAHPGKMGTDVGFTRYRRIKVGKSETSDLPDFPKRICANT
jgi:hypothetical protein